MPITNLKCPSWLSAAVFYQIYPQSFADSNGDGIGDLPGIISRLDYLQSLGVNALWLNPIFESPFGDAGYDVADFRKIAPRYGTHEDAVRLFKEAHARGMRVVLDLVAGHTSTQHPWFQDSSRRAPGEFRDRYIWTDTPWSALGEKGFIVGNCERAAAYHANFFYFQPSLNYGFARPDPAKPWQQPVTAPGPQATRAELRGIMDFWLRAGCDGFRVDMADSLIKGDPDRTGIRELWREFRAWLDADWPEAVLISEWGNPAESIGAGFHVDFLLHFGQPAYRHLMSPCIEPAPRDNRFAQPCYLQPRDGIGPAAFVENYLHHLNATAGIGYTALPSGNHDFSRPAYGRTPDDLRVVFATLLTLPSVPFLYYGDEIGLRYRDDLPSKEGGYGRTGARTPMQWRADAPNLGFSTAPADQLYLPVDSSADAPTVSAQEQDPESLLNHIRRLLALRREHPALGNDGDFEPLHATAEASPFVYCRRHGDHAVLVAVNPTDRAHTCPLDLPAASNARPLLVRGVQLAPGHLCCAPRSYGLFALSASKPPV